MRSPRSTVDDDYIRDLFAGFGPVVIRRMFGGAGIYADSTMLALIADGNIFLKADEVTIPAFEREGLGPFIYTAKNAKRVAMSYWRIPDRLYDDPDELARWAKDALAAARRVATAGSAAKSSKSKSAKLRRPYSRPGPLPDRLR